MLTIRTLFPDIAPYQNVGMLIALVLFAILAIVFVAQRVKARRARAAEAQREAIAAAKARVRSTVTAREPVQHGGRHRRKSDPQEDRRRHAQGLTNPVHDPLHPLYNTVILADAANTPTQAACTTTQHTPSHSAAAYSAPAYCAPSYSDSSPSSSDGGGGGE